jgi:hypothetical protein
MYYGTPPIVTNGLVLNLDAANSLSIPNDPVKNLLYTNGTYTPSISNLTINTSASIIEPNVKFRITTTTFIPPFTFGSFRLNIPLSVLASGKPYSLSYNYQIISGSSFQMNDWCDTALFNVVNTNLGTYSYSSATGVRSVYDSTFRFMDFSVSENTIVDIWDMQLVQNTYSPTFTSSSRTTWFDLSGLNNTTTLTTSSSSGSIPQYSSPNQRVLNFNGSGSSALVNSVWSYLSSSATEAFFSVNNFVSSSGNTSIGGYDQSDTATFSFPIVGMIAIDNSTRKVFSSVITTTQVYRTVTSTTTLNTGSYYHVVLNKDTTNGVLQLYVNGVLESTTTFDTGSYAQWTTTGSFRGSDTIRLSNTLSNNTSFNTKFFNGAIPTFRIYNRVISQQEVTQNYNALKSRFGLQ